MNQHVRHQQASTYRPATAGANGLAAHPSQKKSVIQAMFGCCSAPSPAPYSMSRQIGDRFWAARRENKPVQEQKAILEQWKSQLYKDFQTSGVKSPAAWKRYNDAEKACNGPNLEAEESAAKNAMVDNSSRLNQYIASGRTPGNETLDRQLAAFTRAMQKIGKTTHDLTSKTDWLPGATERGGTVGLTAGQEVVDPIIRFYGEGLVSDSGKMTIRIGNLQAYDFTNHHSNLGYDEAVAGEGKEDQIVTLPGTRLRYDGKSGDEYKYTYLGEG